MELPGRAEFVGPNAKFLKCISTTVGGMAAEESLSLEEFLRCVRASAYSRRTGELPRSSSDFKPKPIQSHRQTTIFPGEFRMEARAHTEELSYLGLLSFSLRHDGIRLRTTFARNSKSDQTCRLVPRTF